MKCEERDYDYERNAEKPEKECLAHLDLLSELKCRTKRAFVPAVPEGAFAPGCTR